MSRYIKSQASRDEELDSRTHKMAKWLTGILKKKCRVKSDRSTIPLYITWISKSQHFKNILKGRKLLFKSQKHPGTMAHPVIPAFRRQEQGSSEFMQVQATQWNAAPENRSAQVLEYKSTYWVAVNKSKQTWHAIMSSPISKHEPLVG